MREPAIYKLGRALAFGYVRGPGIVDAAYVKAGRYEIEIAGTRYAARASLTPFYDPKSERMRG